MNALFDQTYEQLQREESVEAPVAGLIAELYAHRSQSSRTEDRREMAQTGIRATPYLSGVDGRSVLAPLGGASEGLSRRRRVA